MCHTLQQIYSCYLVSPVILASAKTVYETDFTLKKLKSPQSLHGLTPLSAPQVYALLLTECQERGIIVTATMPSQSFFTSTHHWLSPRDLE
jgi:hypothetical protein